MKHSERFALDHFLSTYPQEATFDEVCELLLDEDPAATPWQWFENTPRAELVENIDNTRSHFECVVDGMKWGIELAKLTEEETETERKTHAPTN
jgi:hypothetical protein